MVRHNTSVKMRSNCNKMLKLNSPLPNFCPVSKCISFVSNLPPVGENISSTLWDFELIANHPNNFSMPLGLKIGTSGTVLFEYLTLATLQL